MSDQQYLYISLISCIGYFLIDFFNPEYIDKENDIYINITSLTNALITGIPSLLIMSNDNIIYYFSTTNPLDIEMKYKIVPFILYGYSIYELQYFHFNCFILKTKQYDMLIHAMMMFLFLSLAIYYNSTHLTTIASIQEISSIFLNCRCNDTTRLLFFFTYSYFRMYMFPKLVIEYLYINPYNTDVYFLLALGTCISISLNTFWYKKILSMFLKGLKKKLE